MASKNNFIKPPVVLAVVCACCCGLLAVANSVTKDKIAAAEAASIFSLQTMKKQLQPLSMWMKTSRLLFW